jgi:hypothetical protein
MVRIRDPETPVVAGRGEAYLLAGEGMSSMRRGVIVLALLAAAGARADDEWTATDTALEAGFAVALAGDWLQSRSVAGIAFETNPILGRRPSRATIDTYFAGVLALHLVVSAALPRPYRTVWQSVWFTVESAVVYRNAQAGIVIRF